MEVLHRCPGCNSTQEYRLGADDLSKQIAGSKEELKRMIIRRKKAARRIQAAYRSYLSSWLGRAIRNRKEVTRMLLYRAATAVQSLVRGRLGRRKAICCRKQNCCI